MSSEPDPPFSLMCSGCYTPCSGADAHVIPKWNREMRRILTTYRCGKCWGAALVELRAQLASEEAEVQTSFCDFLARHGYTKDAEAIRAFPPETRQVYLIKVVDAVEAQANVFDP
jgi:predicted metal-binding protein